MNAQPQQGNVLAAASTFRTILHVLMGGHPTAGKSTCATTFPKPLIVKLFDGHGKDTPYLKWGMLHGAQIRSDFLYLTNGQNTGIVRRYIETQSAGTIIVEYFNDLSPDSWAYHWFTTSLKEKAFVQELQNANNPSGAGTLVIDSVTFMELSARKHWMSNVGKVGKRNDGTEDRWAPLNASTDYLEHDLIVELGGINTNYLVLAHYADAKVDVNGEQLYTISAPGRLMKNKELLAAFSEQYRAYVQRQGTERFHLLQTRPSAQFQCATQIDAPDPCWQDYEALWGNWRG